MNVTLGWKLEKVSLAWWVTCGHLWALSTCVFVLFVHRSMHADEKYSSYPSRLNYLFTTTASIFGSKKKGYSVLSMNRFDLQCFRSCLQYSALTVLLYSQVHHFIGVTFAGTTCLLIPFHCLKYLNQPNLRKHDPLAIAIERELRHKFVSLYVQISSLKTTI